MARIQLGNGKRYQGKVVVAFERHAGNSSVPDEVTLVISTPEGDSQRNFSINIELSRDEALTLSADVCNGLKTPTPTVAKAIKLGRRVPILRGGFTIRRREKKGRKK